MWENDETTVMDEITKRTKGKAMTEITKADANTDPDANNGANRGKAGRGKAGRAMIDFESVNKFFGNFQAL